MKKSVQCKIDAVLTNSCSKKIMYYSNMCLFVRDDDEIHYEEH